jgi:hypothetical protein
MGLPRESVKPFDPDTPSVARVWDYWLGGKNNFPADRELAEKMLAINPLAAQIAKENRRFLGRAVSYAAGTVRDVTTAFTRAVAPGSYVIISVGTGQDEVAGPFTAAYSPAPLYVHSPNQIMAFFDSLELVPPGLVPAGGWNGGTATPLLAARQATFLAGVGRKTPGPTGL